MEYHAEFLTGTILNWQNLLSDTICKNIILDSFEWLVKQHRCKIYAFVIMQNHIHVLWQISEGQERETVQKAFFSFTAHQFQKYLRKTDPDRLTKHFVNAADRKFQFWERNPMVKECWSYDFLVQKLDYIHKNPCQEKWQLASSPVEYRWSSCAFYELGDLSYRWLSHHEGFD